MSVRVAFPAILVTSVMLVTVAHSEEPTPEKAHTTTEMVTAGASILTAIPSAMTTIANYYKHPVMIRWTERSAK